MHTRSLFALLFLALMLVPSVSLALSSSQKKEFDRIAKLSMAELTEEAGELLEKKYPDEDWDAFKFPQYVYTNESVEIGYMVAVKNPNLLAKFPCYCFCDAMGHKNLLHCFLKKGIFGTKYDDHAANCNICYGQAMMAFLWADMGATDETIQQGFDKRFERLLKQQSQQAEETKPLMACFPLKRGDPWVALSNDDPMAMPFTKPFPAIPFKVLLANDAV